MQVKKIEESKNSYRISYAIDCNASEDGDETALIIEEGDKTTFAILNGDWIEKYQACKSKEEQVQIFRDNYDEHGGFWTNPLEEVEEAHKANK